MSEQESRVDWQTEKIAKRWSRWALIFAAVVAGAALVALGLEYVDAKAWFDRPVTSLTVGEFIVVVGALLIMFRKS